MGIVFSAGKTVCGECYPGNIHVVIPYHSYYIEMLFHSANQI